MRDLLIPDAGPLIGTVGLLVLAKQKGLIESIGEDLQQLAETRYRLSPELLADALPWP